MTFGVEVEHVRYALLLDTEKSNRGEIDLTTLADNQKTAFVKIFLFENHTKTLIHTIKLNPLPPKSAGDIRIICSAQFTSNRYLQLEVCVGQKTFHTGTVDLNKYRKRSRWWIIPLAIILLGGIAAAFIIAADRRTASSTELGRDAASAAAAEAPDSEEPAGIGGSGTDAVGSEGTDTDAAGADPAGDNAEAVDGGGTDGTSTAGSTESAAAEPEQPAPEPVITVTREELYFLPESSVLLEQAKGKLNAVRSRVESENVRITAIEGHCALYGTEESREWLSEERAEQAYLYLRQIGTDFPESPIVRGFGGQKPATRERNSQELNRRVEIIIETTSYRDE